MRASIWIEILGAVAQTGVVSSNDHYDTKTLPSRTFFSGDIIMTLHLVVFSQLLQRYKQPLVLYPLQLRKKNSLKSCWENKFLDETASALKWSTLSKSLNCVKPIFIILKTSHGDHKSKIESRSYEHLNLSVFWATWYNEKVTVVIQETFTKVYHRHKMSS